MAHSRAKKQILRRLSQCFSILLVAVAALLVTAEPSSAYTDGGCKWSSSTLYLDARYANGDYRTALTQATSNYTAATQVNLYVSGSGNSFHAENASYGANGWEGYTDWNCLNFGRKSSATSRLNMYYLDGSSVTTGRRKVVWLHELGHGLGLGHVPSIYHVMYQSASQAYLNGGVRSLTSDEIAGINSWY